MRRSERSRANLESPMNRLIYLSLFWLTMSFSSLAGSEAENDHNHGCGEQPEPSMLPEAANRSESTLSAARDGFIEYQKQNEQYLDCLLTFMEELALSIDETGTAGLNKDERENNKRRYAMIGMAYNEAVSTEEKAALELNEAIERYR